MTDIREQAEQTIAEGFASLLAYEQRAERVRAIIAAEFCLEAKLVTDDAELRATLGADSFDLWSLASALEEQLELPPIDDKAIADVVTVADVIALVEGVK